MECEEAIQPQLNQASRLATGCCLKDFDTDGLLIIMANQKSIAKAPNVPKYYETPYGEIQVAKYCYQRTKGGAAYILFFPGSKNIQPLRYSIFGTSLRRRSIFVGGPPNPNHPLIRPATGSSMSAGYLFSLLKNI